MTTAFNAQKRRKTSLTDNGWKGFLFVLPNLVGFTIFTIIPVIFAFGISFTKWDFYKGLAGISFAGLKNYMDLGRDLWFKSSISNNILYTLGTLPPLIVLSMLIAVALNTNLLGRNVVRSCVFLPYVINTVAIAAIGLLIFNMSGPLNMLLQAFGVSDPPKWLSSLEWAMPAVMIMSVWQGLGYDVIIYLSGLQAIPEELYEAATIDGANGVQRLLHVTVPMLRATTFFLLVTNIISSFQVFGLINVLTQGGPARATTVLAYYIYRLAFVYNKMGPACAVSVVLFLIVLTVTLIQWKFQRKSELETGSMK
ncbi:MAG: sugar ABC transporter permease [Eubacteriales bacterium]|nr:sugar ABC transporter permease [Eubacteriales bacterium]